MLNIGDKTSLFEAKDENGNLWKLSEHIGEKIWVVYFYPAAMTSGCTKQACSYRDSRDVLEENSIGVVGISGDAQENLRIFKQTHNLNFTLLSDHNGDIAKQFGVPVGQGGSIVQSVDEKEVTLTRGVTAKRWTFVVDKQGQIIYKNTNVDPVTDSHEILKAVVGK